MTRSATHSEEPGAFPQRSRHFRTERRHLVYLKFVTEAYEGLCTLSTVDRKGGVVRITYSPEAEEDVSALLAALTREIALCETAPPADYPEPEQEDP